MDSMPTIVETGRNNDNGWGGNAWGAGAGAFIGSLFGNGGFGGWGWGNRGNAGQVGADVALQNGIQNLGNQIQQGNLMNLQGQNQLQQGISGAVAGVTGGIYQMDFNPSMITDNEWLKANVYAAPLMDTRMSKLLAICKVKQTGQQAPQETPAEADKPIRVEEIVNASGGNMQRNKGKGREGQ